MVRLREVRPDVRSRGNLVLVPMPRTEDRLKAALGAYLPVVWRVLRRAGVEASDAEELAQEVFLVLFRRLDQVPAASERSFLIGTAVRMASDRRKRYQRRPPHDELSAAIPGGQSPDEIAELRRARADLDEFLEGLPEAQRAVFVLVELEGLTAPEASAALEIPTGTVASRLRTARAAFEAALKRLAARRGER
jgi:RNA polymerase sigma-70 factor (ECF subfamily)